MSIRPYTAADYPIIDAWWQFYSEIGPTQEMLPEESTYIYEDRGAPVLCVTLYLTNTKEFCMVDNFVRNPGFKDLHRKQAITELLAYIENKAKGMGYKKMLCMGYRDKIKNIYRDLGFVSTLNNVETFIKEVK